MPDPGVNLLSVLEDRSSCLGFEGTSEGYRVRGYLVWIILRKEVFLFEA